MTLFRSVPLIAAILWLAGAAAGARADEPRFTTESNVADAATLAALGITSTPETSASPLPPRRIAPHAGSWSWNSGAYSYDGSGNITAIGTQSFVYDVDGRLTGATLTRPDQPESLTHTYVYDRFGNMTSRTEGTLPIPTPTSPATNHLTSLAAVYDAAGNVTQLQPPHQGYLYEYKYDALNAMQQMKLANVTDETRRLYVYTAGDERIWSYDLAANVSHWKIRDLSGAVLRDFVDSGSTWTVDRDYIYRGSALLSAVTPAETLHFSLDHLGTPRVITDSSRTRVGFHHYFPFGQEWLDGSGAQEGEARKFTGHERDPDPAAGQNGLDYMHARYYSSRAGRFLAVDPGRDWDLRQPQSWNMYTYVRNNPMNRIDPTGRCGEKAGFVGPTIPCAEAESTPKPENPPKQAGGRTPAQGQEPGTTTEFPAEGGGKTVRTYGPDGRAVTDVDHGHDHGAGDPHVHDWDWTKNRPRQQGRAPNPGEIPEPSKSTTAGPQRPDLKTIIGATILAIGGTAIMIMTGGGLALQPRAGGVVIVPRSGIDPTDQSDCPASLPCA